MTRYATISDRDYLQSQLRTLRTDIMDVHALAVNLAGELREDARDTRADVDRLLEAVQDLTTRADYLASDLDDLDQRLDAVAGKVDLCLMLIAKPEREGTV